MISETQTVNSSSQTNSDVQSSNQVMGKDDFLNLLVTQLKYQDPLNPTDSTEFTAQLAQFSSLEMLENINSNVEITNEGQASLTNSQAVSYIGKKVYAFGSDINVSDGVSNSINFELAANASAVYINIYDQLGNLVDNIQEGTMDAGENQVTWDGKNTDGEQVEDGTYSFEVYAYDYNENSVDTIAYMENDITGVSYYDNQPYLYSGDITIPISSVFKVLENINENET